MNKQNLGYRLGKWYRKFRQWQHPTILKWLYVLIMGAIIFIFWNFFVWAFIVAFGIMIATRQSDNLEPIKQSKQHCHNTLYESYDDNETNGLEITPAGYYLDGFKIDDE